MNKREQAELLHAASCMRVALNEMIETFAQPRFQGAYPKCLERSRQALAAGAAFLDRPANAASGAARWQQRAAVLQHRCGCSDLGGRAANSSGHPEADRARSTAIGNGE